MSFPKASEVMTSTLESSASSFKPILDIGTLPPAPEYKWGLLPPVYEDYATFFDKRFGYTKEFYAGVFGVQCASMLVPTVRYCDDLESTDKPRPLGQFTSLCGGSGQAKSPVINEATYSASLIDPSGKSPLMSSGTIQGLRDRLILNGAEMQLVLTNTELMVALGSMNAHQESNMGNAVLMQELCRIYDGDIISKSMAGDDKPKRVDRTNCSMVTGVIPKHIAGWDGLEAALRFGFFGRTLFYSNAGGVRPPDQTLDGANAVFRWREIQRSLGKLRNTYVMLPNDVKLLRRFDSLCDQLRSRAHGLEDTDAMPGFASFLNKARDHILRFASMFALVEYVEAPNDPGWDKIEIAVGGDKISGNYCRIRMQPFHLLAAIGFFKDFVSPQQEFHHRHVMSPALKHEPALKGILYNIISRLTNGETEIARKELSGNRPIRAIRNWDARERDEMLQQVIDRGWVAEAVGARHRSDESGIVRAGSYAMNPAILSALPERVREAVQHTSNIHEKMAEAFPETVSAWKRRYDKN